MNRAKLVISFAVLLAIATTVIAELPTEEPPASTPPRNRVREGTELRDAPGTFRLTGDRATFILADGSARFGGLENLTLERVANVIAGDPSPLEWSVSGVVTEYKGNNYLLVTRAILKSKTTASERPADRLRRGK
jgi:hypothetical protein